MTTQQEVFKATQKAQLETMRQELAERIRAQLHSSEDPELMSLARHMAEVDDEHVADQLMNADVALLTHELKELREIDLALQRIANGTYGICSECGRMIDPARLSARPVARMCVPCKTAFEKRRGIVMSAVV